MKIIWFFCLFTILAKALTYDVLPDNFIQYYDGSDDINKGYSIIPLNEAFLQNDYSDDQDFAIEFWFKPEQIETAANQNIVGLNLVPDGKQDSGLRIFSLNNGDLQVYISEACKQENLDLYQLLCTHWIETLLPSVSTTWTYIKLTVIDDVDTIQINHSIPRRLWKFKNPPFSFYRTIYSGGYPGQNNFTGFVKNLKFTIGDSQISGAPDLGLIPSYTSYFGQKLEYFDTDGIPDSEKLTIQLRNSNFSNPLAISGHISNCTDAETQLLTNSHLEISIKSSHLCISIHGHEVSIRETLPLSSFFFAVNIDTVARMVTACGDTSCQQFAYTANELLVMDKASLNPDITYADLRIYPQGLNNLEIKVEQISNLDLDKYFICDQWSTSNIFQWLSCPNGTAISNGRCKPCSPACHSCFEPSQPYACNECATGYSDYNFSTCLKTCPTQFDSFCRMNGDGVALDLQFEGRLNSLAFPENIKFGLHRGLNPEEDTKDPQPAKGRGMWFQNSIMVIQDIILAPDFCVLLWSRPMTGTESFINVGAFGEIPLLTLLAENATLYLRITLNDGTQPQAEFSSTTLLYHLGSSPLKTRSEQYKSETSEPWILISCSVMFANPFSSLRISLDEHQASIQSDPGLFTMKNENISLGGPHFMGFIYSFVVYNYYRDLGDEVNGLFYKYLSICDISEFPQHGECLQCYADCKHGWNKPNSWHFWYQESCKVCMTDQDDGWLECETDYTLMEGFCKRSNWPHGQLIQEGSCVAQWDQGYVLTDSRECLPCIEDCQTCAWNASNITCVTCLEGFELEYEQCVEIIQEQEVENLVVVEQEERFRISSGVLWVVSILGLLI